MTAVTTAPGALAEAGTEARPKGRKPSVTAFGLLFPSIIGVLLFLAIPVVFVIVLSFMHWNMLTPARWAGVSNYVNIFRFEGALHALMVTAIYVALNIPLQTVLALGMAMVLNRRGRITSLVRLICVLPYLATPVAMAVVWQWFFDPTTGVINTVLGFFGITGPSWLNSQIWALPVVAFANIWQYVGYNMLFFLAGLQAIPHTMYEAAAVDGASPRGRFFRITLPLLRPTMLFVLVTSVIGSFQVFDTVWVLTQGGPGRATTVMIPRIYQMAFQNFRIGDAAAMSVVLFVVILAFTIAQFRYFQKRTVYQMV